MNIAERFERYASDFELTKQDGDWSRITAHFHIHASRREEIPPLLNIHIEGRNNLISQWREMIENFDLEFDYRFVKPLAPAVVHGNQVKLRWIGVYAIEGAPALLGEGTEIATYEGKLIIHLETTMTPETVERNLVWFTQYGSRLSPKLQTYIAQAAGTTRPVLRGARAPDIN